MIYESLTRYMDWLFLAWDSLTDEQKEYEARRMNIILEGIMDVCRWLGCAHHAYIQLRDIVAVHIDFWNLITEVKNGTQK